MKQIKLILICCLTVLLLCGCGLKEGYIIDKEESTFATTDDLSDHTYKVYIFYVQSCKNGNVTTNKWFVSKKIYDTYNLDDYVTLDDISDK